MTTGTSAAAAVIALFLLCHCSSAQDERAKPQHDHARTKSSSVTAPRAQLVTGGMPVLTAGVAASPPATGDDDASATVDGVLAAKDDDGSVLREYLFRRPSHVFRGLMLTGVDVVQRSMDKFQGVSSKMFKVARRRTRRASSGATGSAARAIASTTANQPDPAAGGGASTPVKPKPKSKFPADLGDSMFKIIDTGIAGMEQATDLGLLLGNIGTHKIRAGLDGKSGNQEIFNLLIKYVGSRVGMGSKGSPVQMIDDVGTISTFVATDDQVTNSISLLMERMMANPKVSTALVRTAITILDSSPSTSCLLDNLPLSPADIRLAFDVFVGSNGQIMLKTIAGLLSDLTTGPDTRAFLESVMGMMSMFKSSDSPAQSDSVEPPKPTSLFGSLTGFFMGSDDGGGVKKPEQTAVPSPTATPSSSLPPPTPVSRKKMRDRVKKPAAPVMEDSWFTDDDDDNEIKPKRPSTTKSLKRDQSSRSMDVKTASGRVSSKKTTGNDGDSDGKSKTQSSKMIKSKQPASSIDDDWWGD